MVTCAPINEVKLCDCGCGQPTSVAVYNSISRGLIKGQGRKFLKGHCNKTPEGRAKLKGFRIQQRWEVDPISGCWNWLLAKINGYGVQREGGSNTSAHIVKYEEKYGPVPDGLELDHLCRNRSCVNPDHLEAVTRAVNTQRGDKAKLNPESVTTIRSLWGTGNYTQVELGRTFGVSGRQISEIVRRMDWKNI